MRKHCDTCIRDEFGDYCKHCECPEGKPPSQWKPVDWWTPDTNADRIRAMSDEELAKCIYEIGFDCHLCSEHERLSDNQFLRHEKCDEKCVEHCLEWLKKPAEGE
jgi:hypothetical protein